MQNHVPHRHGRKFDYPNSPRATTTTTRRTGARHAGEYGTSPTDSLPSTPPQKKQAGVRREHRGDTMSKDDRSRVTRIRLKFTYTFLLGGVRCYFFRTLCVWKMQDG
ncbi:hypothetical protein EYF80_053981 [Liparis tanakae]|uniref:Uncharacterized protein n=1 Tax=Liparis tanakae TaxID=230148 RepID=A0A4Z2F3X4_9TELE|nr:hypothetical protein EYF80_053981 [Liparis tanakae]